MNTKEKYFRPIISFHPGKTLNNKLNEMGMGVKEFSERTGKPEKTIFAVLNGDSSVTSDMAIIFEKVTGIPAHFLLAKQKNYDEFLARKKQEELMASASAWAKKFPVSEMANKGWFAPGKTCAEKTKYNAFNDLEYTLSLNETISDENQKNRHQKTPKFIVPVKDINKSDEFNDEFYEEYSNEEYSNEEYLIAG